MKTFYTVEETADHFRVSGQTVRLWIRDGKINAHRFGRKWLIPASEIERASSAPIDMDTHLLAQPH